MDFFGFIAPGVDAWDSFLRDLPYDVFSYADLARPWQSEASERGKQLMEQLDLAITDLEESQAEEETKAELAAPGKQRENRERSGISQRAGRCRTICHASASSIRRLALAANAAAPTCASSARP